MSKSEKEEQASAGGDVDDEAPAEETAAGSEDEPEQDTESSAESSSESSSDKAAEPKTEAADETAGRASKTAAGDDAGRRSQGGASVTLTWLAFLVALIAVAATGYLYLEKFREAGAAADARAEVEALSTRLGELEDGVAALEETAGDASAAADRANSRLSTLEREFDDKTQLLESLPQRMGSLERSVAGLQGISIDARNTYLVAEAEYYMQIANVQLQLARNPTLAALALEQADDRLLQLGDPALTEVRRAIADELAALAAVQRADVAGVALTLASLSRVVDSLPLKAAPGIDDGVVREDEDGDEGAVAGAWNTVKDAFSKIVTYTPPAQEDAPLLLPEAEPLVRSNLSLQLQAARLALLQSEQALFEQSLDDAQAWLETYFATSTEPVQSALETLEEIRGDYRRMTPPDISESLRLLREYKSLLENRE